MMTWALIGRGRTVCCRLWQWEGAAELAGFIVEVGQDWAAVEMTMVKKMEGSGITGATVAEEVIAPMPITAR